MTLQDGNAQPPTSLRGLFKKWQRSSVDEILHADEILDVRRNDRHNALTRIDYFSGREGDIEAGVHDFLEQSCHPQDSPSRPGSTKQLDSFEIRALPGLFIFPSLLAEQVQLTLLDQLLHRDLSNSNHQTNIHLFHQVVYPSGFSVPGRETESFFTMDPRIELQPKDSDAHKPMSVARMLQRKLRWITLGGQYDWTAKEYPNETAPAFPPDVALLLKALFPDVDAEAAIINFYSPGDTLSVHRDVSEDCDRGLISISLGCDGIFLVGNEDESSHITLRLRSGDVVLMTGTSRFAWHAVPKILPDTCPPSLRPWPANEASTKYEQWRGWLETKRININVRQMQESLGSHQ